MGECRCEPKVDGFLRCIAHVKEDGGVQLWSGSLERLNEAFPEIAFAALPPGTVVDGEIVRWGRDGRVDFAAPQRRHVVGRRRAELAVLPVGDVWRGRMRGVVRDVPEL